MAGSSGPDLITNGLVLALDAADKNSYLGSGTSWYDLSGNGYNGTLINGSTFSNSYRGGIVFDGTDDYAPTGVSSTTITPTNSWTVSMWCSLNSYPVVSGTNKEGILYGYAYYGGLGIYAISVSTGNVGVYGFFRSDTASVVIGPYTWTTNTPTMFTLVHISGTGCRFFVNGSFLNSSSTTGGSWPNYMPNPFNLIFSYAGVYGGGTQTYINYPITAYSSNVYTKALTDTEVLQNYNATKSRFGL